MADKKGRISKSQLEQMAKTLIGEYKKTGTGSYWSENSKYWLDGLADYIKRISEGSYGHDVRDIYLTVDNNKS